MQHFRPVRSAIYFTALAFFAGCGGGGSTGSSSTPNPNPPPPSSPAPQVLSGTVAVGAPMLNATVTVRDAAGTERSVSAGADGKYAGLSVEGLVAPFRVQACGLVNGDYICLHSLAPSSGTANVTPLTQAGVTLALGQDAAAMFGGSNVAAPDKTKFDAVKAQLTTALSPVLSALGLPSSLDFASTPFSADRTGMDKLLDAVRITTGTDPGTGASSKTFVQVEGRIGAGNVYLTSDGSKTGILAAGPALDVDLKGISALFKAMSDAVGTADASSCAQHMSDAAIFDPAFKLSIEDGPLMTASTAPAMLCSMISRMNMLGGMVANPVLRSCDFSGADKSCLVSFDVIREDTVFEGAELALVLRSGSAQWGLLGTASGYEIHVNANVQKTIRIDVENAVPEYTRAISFDIKSKAEGQETAVRAAKVYQHDAAGTGWDGTPIVTLTMSDACLGRSPRLAVVSGDGSNCDSTWLSLERFGQNLTDGDELIDKFYKRGREVRIVLFSDVAGTQELASVIKRVDGVPPKSAALPSMPWWQIDTATVLALKTLDRSNSSFTLTLLANAGVSAKDVSFCLSASCSGAARAAHSDLSSTKKAVSTKTLSLSQLPAAASSYKQLSVYGRNYEQMGVQTNFVSCGGAPQCPQN